MRLNCPPTHPDHLPDHLPHPCRRCGSAGDGRCAGVPQLHYTHTCHGGGAVAGGKEALQRDGLSRCSCCSAELGTGGPGPPPRRCLPSQPRLRRCLFNNAGVGACSPTLPPPHPLPPPHHVLAWQVEAHAKLAGGGLRIVGYFQANERLGDSELGSGRRVADRVEAASPDAVAAVVSG